MAFLGKRALSKNVFTRHLLDLNEQFHVHTVAKRMKLISTFFLDTHIEHDWVLDFERNMLSENTFLAIMQACRGEIPLLEKSV